MKKLIIFDIGGVLVDFMEEMYISYLHRRVLPGITYRKLEKFIMPLIELMEYGTLNVTELEGMVAKHFGLKNVRLQWVEGFRETARPKPRMISLVKRMQKNYQVVLLSNVSYSRFDELKDTYLDGLKVRVFLSCEMKLRKPGPRIYEQVLKAMHVKPEEAIFIDNQIENVIGAEKAGITALWFRNYKKLMEDFEDEGIKV